MSLTMYDTVTVETVPANPPAVAGYVGGRWPTFGPLVARFPHARHLSIAVTAGERARCLDVEAGDARPDQAPGWFRSLADRSQGLPVLYTSASNVDGLVRTMAGAGVKRNEYLVWSAHYTYQPHICSPRTCGYPQADGTQWTDRALGRNLDQSLVSDQFFGPPPPPPDPHHYNILTRLERHVVIRYDGAREQPIKYRAYLICLRGILGVLANKVWVAAHVPGGGGWDIRNRGERFQMLWRRYKGQKLV